MVDHMVVLFNFVRQGLWKNVTDTAKCFYILSPGSGLLIGLKPVLDTIRVFILVDTILDTMVAKNYCLFALTANKVSSIMNSNLCLIKICVVFLCLHSTHLLACFITL